MPNGQEKSNNIENDINNSLNKVFPIDEDKNDMQNRKDYNLKINLKGDNYHNTKIIKENNTWKYILGIFILLLLIIGILLILYYLSGGYNTTDSTTTDTSQTDENIGAMIPSSKYYVVDYKVIKNVNGVPKILLPSRKSQFYFLNNTNCQYGYYGDNCQFQANDPLYYNIGSFQMNYDKQYIGYIPLSLDYSLSNGEISKNSCTGICDNTTGCNGVNYNHTTEECNLIMSDIQGINPSKLNFSIPEQIYLKVNHTPHFKNVVFGFYGNRYLRYYLLNNTINPTVKHISEPSITMGLVEFTPNVTVNLYWSPQKIANFEGYIGIYSTTIFDSTNWKETNIIHVDSYVGEYLLPIKLQKYSNIYIMYMPLSEYRK